MKVAYCECNSGISGDMFLGALLDAGLPQSVLVSELDKLQISSEYKIEVYPVMKQALRALSFNVRLTSQAEHVHQPHKHHEEHDQEHHHEHAHENEHDHEHQHEHEHHHEHVHEHEDDHDHEHHSNHAHSHQRNFQDIRQLIGNSGLSQKVKNTSLAIFQTLAEAEGRVHGVPADSVHFHEVGAVDSILDIVGTAVGLEYLGIEQLFASALPMGSGKVQTQHGVLPLPAPATLEILARVGAPVIPSQAQVELVTPTGAAILATLAKFEQPSMRLRGVGIGAGQRDLPWANVLRIILGEVDSAPGEGLVVLETNIDDMNPQLFTQVMEHLFATGALDVFMTPIFMKKNRPGTMLSVIAYKKDESSLAQIILRETTTFGIRVRPIDRHEALRNFSEVTTTFGKVRVKLKILDGKVILASPEFDVCARLAREAGVPVLQVYQAAVAAGLGLIDSTAMAGR
ncbi:MAG TPA: nickel pincer cofactor biosynthesis protein LarC [Anaerolineaceae bacterium]